MNSYKFKVGEIVTYIGKPINWTFNKDIVPGNRGVIDEVTNTTVRIVYSVKFDNDLIASIDEKDLE